MLKTLVTYNGLKSSDSKLVAVPLGSKMANGDPDKVQEILWRLQNDVRMLQEELARTRQALERREVLLRNSQQREIELRAEFGAGRR